MIVEDIYRVVDEDTMLVFIDNSYGRKWIFKADDTPLYILQRNINRITVGHRLMNIYID